MNTSVDHKGTAWNGQPVSATGTAAITPLPTTGTPAAPAVTPPAIPGDASAMAGHAQGTAPIVALVGDPAKGPAGTIRLITLTGTEAERLSQFQSQLQQHFGTEPQRILVTIEGEQLLARTLPKTVVGQTLGNFTDTLKSPWRPLQADPGDAAWVRSVLQSSSSDRLDRLRLPSAASMAPAADPGKPVPGVITVGAITAAAQPQSFVVDAMKRDIAAVADSLRQQTESIELSYNDAHGLQARNRFTGAVYEVRLPNDSYSALRQQMIRQNPTPSLATLGGTRLLTEIQTGGQILGGDGAQGSTFVETMKVTYTTEQNWTFGAGILTSQQLGGDNHQGMSFRLGHNYWGVANVLISPDGKVHLRGVDTQAPREAWNWFKTGSTGRKVAVGGGVLAGAGIAVWQLGKSSKEMVFSDPLPELELGKSRLRVVGGVLGKVSLGGHEDGSFALDGKLTGGTLRLKENGTGGVSNEQGLRYRREHQDDGTLTETLQAQVRGTNRLGPGFIQHSVAVGYDLQSRGLGESSAGAQVVMPFGGSQELSWNAGGNLGLDRQHAVSFGDVRAGMRWQPSPAVSIFGSAGYIKGYHLMDPNLAGGLVGGMMPPTPRGATQGPNQNLGAAVGPDKARMAVTIGAYIRL
jgi:hypothetical protein